MFLFASFDKITLISRAGPDLDAMTGLHPIIERQVLRDFEIAGLLSLLSFAS